MEITAFDRDEILTGYLTDYLDGTLDSAETSAFLEYLDQNEPEKAFARKARRGRRKLRWLAARLDESDLPDLMAETNRG